MLIDREFIRDSLTHEAAWCEGHGAEGGRLGSGLLYYTLTAMLPARKCVCIGSGGGFVPRLMRQAQRDWQIEGETHLIDANRPEAHWGSPQWLADDSYFKTRYADVHVHLMTSADAAWSIMSEGGIDYLHIDGDHSEAGCRADFVAYAPLMSDNHLITFHDTRYHEQNDRCGVHRVIDELRQSDDVELVEMPGIGTGVAIVRVIASRGEHGVLTP